MIKQSGFSLLEAIVTLTLIATTGIALFSWINTNLISLQRVQAAYQRNDAIRNALRFMDTVNPLVAPQGEETLGQYTLRWQAKVVESPKDGINALGYPGLYQVGLYDTQVDVYRHKIHLAHFSLRQVGYKQIRELTAEF